MRMGMKMAAACGLAAALTGPAWAQAPVYADSVADFSGAQGQENYYAQFFCPWIIATGTGTTLSGRSTGVATIASLVVATAGRLALDVAAGCTAARACTTGRRATGGISTVYAAARAVATSRAVDFDLCGRVAAGRAAGIHRTTLVATTGGRTA